MTTKDFEVQDFDRVQVENGFQVTISQGESFKVTITTHENIVPYVRVEKNGSTLRLFVDPRPFTGVNVDHLEATVTMPALEEINGSGGSRLIVAGFQPQPSLGEIVGRQSVEQRHERDGHTHAEQWRQWWPARWRG